MNSFTALLSCIFLVTSLVSGHSFESQGEQVGSVIQNQGAPTDVQPVPVQNSAPQVVHHHMSAEQPQPPMVDVNKNMYAPSSLVGQSETFGPVGVKPVGVSQSVNKEQFGQPESASIPANYKPFGSWGLYIGGNPADGHYTNFYKSLDSGIQGGHSGLVQSGSVGPVSSVGPVYKQQAASPMVGSHQYPYFYSPSELSSGVPVSHYSAYPNSVPVPVPVSSPVDSVPYYADQYALKRIGSPVQQAREISKVSSSSSSAQSTKGGSNNHQQQQAKGYAYASAPALFSPVQYQQQQQYHSFVGQQQPQSQVVAYSVPVSSQIVGSQQGAEGSFNPYGIHAFTRYAIKPTVVSSGSSQNNYYAHGVPVQDVAEMPAVYKQQRGYSLVGQGASYQPFGFYGYPLSQVMPPAPSSSYSSYSSSQSVPVVSSSPSMAVSGSVPVVASNEGSISAGQLAAPPSPVQVGQANVAAAPGSPVQESQVSQQEQVMEKQVEKTGVKQ